MPPASSHGPSTVGKITVGADERKVLKARRETLGLTQRELAAKVGTTNGTISNLENGKHPQIKWSTYARLRYVLFKEKAVVEENVDDVMKDIADELPTLDAHALKAVRTLVSSLKKPK
jgi:transcriptional regulator with XRE-family HTH domain